MKCQMKNQSVKILLILMGVLFLFAMIYISFLENHIDGKDGENSMVLLNEIRQLTTMDDGSSFVEPQIEKLQAELGKISFSEQRKNIRKMGTVTVIAISCYTMILFLYLYVQILRPFRKLEVYADQIAKGNFDVELCQERTNFFGAFTWAFDHMREELIYAKKNEEKAITENKTIIAALSHDIKTPIASIRAYAEGLEAGLDADYEARERYVQVIMKKCDEVTKLTNDLVLHSLSELEHLEIKKQYIDIGKVLESIVSDLEDGHILLETPIPSMKILADGKRVAQVVENLLNNAGKYAPESDISVWAECLEDSYEIHIRDYGEGILPQDMPFVFDKFYRGKNAEEKPGSGLGLYIVKYIMNRMNGDVLLFNQVKGLEAVVVFPIS